MAGILNTTIYLCSHQSTIEEREYEKEIFILTHDHHNGPIT